MLCFIGPQRSQCVSSKGVAEWDDFVPIRCCCCFISTQVSHSPGVSHGVRVFVVSIESDLRVFVKDDA